MNPGWLLYSTLIAMGGVVAGVSGYLLAGALVEGKFIPVTVGFVTLVIVDLAVVMLCYRRLFEKKPPPR